VVWPTCYVGLYAIAMGVLREAGDDQALAR